MKTNRRKFLASLLGLAALPVFLCRKKPPHSELVVPVNRVFSEEELLRIIAEAKIDTLKSIQATYQSFDLGRVDETAYQIVRPTGKPMIDFVVELYDASNPIEARVRAAEILLEWGYGKTPKLR